VVQSPRPAHSEINKNGDGIMNHWFIETIGHDRQQVLLREAEQDRIGNLLHARPSSTFRLNTRRDWRRGLVTAFWPRLAGLAS
jgi:hypothetical protein